MYKILFAGFPNRQLCVSYTRSSNAESYYEYIGKVYIYEYKKNRTTIIIPLFGESN